MSLLVVVWVCALDPDFSDATLTTSDVCVACTQITLMPFSHS